MAVLVGATLYFLNVGIVVPLLPIFAVSSLHANNLLVGLAVGAPALAALVARPFSGGLGNVIGRRRLMIGGALLAGLSTLAYGLSDHMAVLIGLRLLTGAGEGAFFTGALTLVADLAAPARRGAAISLLSVTVFLGAGIGPIIGVPVADHLGSTTTFAVAGLVGIMAAVVCSRTGNPDTSLYAGVRQARLNSKAFAPGAAMALSNMGMAGFFAFVPLYALDVRTPVQLVFLVYAVVVLGIRLCGASIPDRLGPARCGVAASVLDAAGLLIVAASGTRVGLLAGVAVFAVGTALLYPALLSLALTAGTPAERSSIVGTFTMSFDVGTILGAVLLGGIAQLLGLRASFAIAGACAALGLVVLLRLLKTLPRTSVSLSGT